MSQRTKRRNAAEAPPRAKKSTSNNVANLGLEIQLWVAPDKLRNNPDAAGAP